MNEQKAIGCLDSSFLKFRHFNFIALSGVATLGYHFITATSMRTGHLFCFIVTLGFISLTHQVFAAEIQVARWEPHDFSFALRSAQANPFQVAFSADITGPNGIKLSVPGFFDGDGTWKLRISPTAEGAWSLTTHSAVTDLDNQHVEFVCVANPSTAIHGGLHVDPDHPHQFIFEDGAHYFPLGYECDWLWALDSTDPELKTLNPFLDKITGSGFNFIILNAYAHDTSWRKGKTADEDFGPPPLYAWEGSNEKPDFSRFNLAYWQHYDRMMNAMYRRGIVAHVLMRVYNKQVKWPANGSPEDDQYYRWLIARYSAYPNITWDLAKEAQYEKDMTYKTGRMRFIRENDPYHRLLTIHDDHMAYNEGTYNDLVDYRSDQQHAKWRETMLDHLRQHPWPVINTEFGYEHGPKGLKDKTYNVAQEPEEVCRRAWEVYTAGGFGAYYYTYTAWDVLRPQETPPGYAYFKHLREFFDQVGYWRLQPTDGLVSDGYCLADPGNEYVVFLNTAASFTLTLQGLGQPLKAEWFRPLTGDRADAGKVENGTTNLKPPEDWKNGPVALHVGMPGK